MDAAIDLDNEGDGGDQGIGVEAVDWCFEQRRLPVVHDVGVAGELVAQRLEGGMERLLAGRRRFEALRRRRAWARWSAVRAAAAPWRATQIW